MQQKLEEFVVGFDQRLVLLIKNFYQNVKEEQETFAQVVGCEFEDLFDSVSEDEFISELRGDDSCVAEWRTALVNRIQLALAEKEEQPCEEVMTEAVRTPNKE